MYSFVIVSHPLKHFLILPMHVFINLLETVASGFCLQSFGSRFAFIYIQMILVLQQFA